MSMGNDTSSNLDTEEVEIHNVMNIGRLVLS